MWPPYSPASPVNDFEQGMDGKVDLGLVQHLWKRECDHLQSLLASLSIQEGCHLLLLIITLCEVLQIGSAFWWQPWLGIREEKKEGVGQWSGEGGRQSRVEWCVEEGSKGWMQNGFSQLHLLVKGTEYCYELATNRQSSRLTVRRLFEQEHWC